MKKILIVDDDLDISELLKSFLGKNQFDVDSVSNGEAAIKYITNKKIDLILCDYRLPDIEGIDLLRKIKTISPKSEVIIITGYSDVRIAVKALKLGAFDYITKPLYPDEILLTINSALESSRHHGEATTIKKTFVNSDYIIGESVQAQQVEKHIDLIAPTHMTVIIEGETGTGKEYVAKAIHSRSDRKDKPFVAIDCGAISNELASSELFGHVKGSFTGAVVDKKGSFEMANGGSLFLDEIGNLSYENQIKLLRVLQERKINRIGGNDDISIDVRIIVATNENLKDAVKENRFREDIYHRLNEFKIELSPLRQRQSDIQLFANHFLRISNKILNKHIEGFEEEALVKLSNYYWHGNIRELLNVVKRAVLLCSEKYIQLENLPIEIVENQEFAKSDITTTETNNLKQASEIAEKQVILEALKKVDYNKSKAAEALKIDRKTLYNKLKAYNIDY